MNKRKLIHILLVLAFLTFCIVTEPTHAATQQSSEPEVPFDSTEPTEPYTPTQQEIEELERECGCTMLYFHSTTEEPTTETEPPNEEANSPRTIQRTEATNHTPNTRPSSGTRRSHVRQYRCSRLRAHTDLQPIRWHAPIRPSQARTHHSTPKTHKQTRCYVVATG